MRRYTYRNYLPCNYNKICLLPINNKYYLGYTIYLILAIGMYLFSREKITFSGIFIFLAPIELDIIFNHLIRKFLNRLRIFFIVIDGFSLLLSVMGMLGQIQYNGQYSFIVIIPSLGVASVDWIFYVFLFTLIINILIPIILGFGRPSQLIIQNTKTYAHMINKLDKEDRK